MSRLVYNIQELKAKITVSFGPNVRDYMTNVLTSLGTKVLKDNVAAAYYTHKFLARYDDLHKSLKGVATLQEGDTWNEEYGKRVALDKLLERFVFMRLKFIEFIKQGEEKKLQQLKENAHVYHKKLEQIITNKWK